MPVTWKGILRVKNPPPMENDVIVVEDWGDDSVGGQNSLPESIYRARGHRPPVEDLPWRQDPPKRA